MQYEESYRQRGCEDVEGPKRSVGPWYYHSDGILYWIYNDES